MLTPHCNQREVGGGSSVTGYCVWVGLGGVVVVVLLGGGLAGGAVQGALLRQLVDGPLVFEGVDERLDPPLDAGGDPAGHRVAGRRGAAGLLGGGAGHQTLLVAELKDMKGRRAGQTEER